MSRACVCAAPHRLSDEKEALQTELQKQNAKVAELQGEIKRLSAEADRSRKEAQEASSAALRLENESNRKDKRNMAILEQAEERVLAAEKAAAEAAQVCCQLHL